MLDEHGYCRIVGRSKDVIIRGGENIFPKEVEECLREHPDFEDVEVGFAIQLELYYGDPNSAISILHFLCPRVGCGCPRRKIRRGGLRCY